MPFEAELVLRLVLSGALGGAIGLEREVSDQPAGFRTHILVALGSCLFTLVSAFGFQGIVAGAPGEVLRTDPGRVAAQIVVGIGFLGGGAILKYGTSVRGLTTAASLWVVAAVGLAVGVGMYLMGTVTAALTLLALWALKPLRKWLVRGLRAEHEEVVVTAGSDLDLGLLVREVSDSGIRIDHLRIEDEGDDLRQITLFLKLPPGRVGEDAVALLSHLPGVRNVDWAR